ncbi:MAG: UPF0489 family protein [Spirochaetales bacterium]|nr:UPF0489 family protein [Spirochaetales bacterium]
MEHLKIGDKDVYIVKSHNRVLEAWERIPPCNVFTLDYHTDTKKAFSTYAYWRADSEKKAGKCESRLERKKELVQEKLRGYLNNRLSIRTINDNLRHDEHIDFSVRTGIADRVFVLSHNRNEGSANPRVYQYHGDSDYEGEPIVEYPLESEPGLTDRILSDAVEEARNLEEGFFDRYILDLDCDFFTTGESLESEFSEVFGELVSQAEMITIAKEPECVKICREEGSGLTGEIIKDRLLEMIEDILLP